MAKTMSICGVSDEIRVKMRLIAVGKRISMAELLEQLVNREWNEGKTPATREYKRKARRLLRKYKGGL